MDPIQRMYDEAFVEPMHIDAVVTALSQDSAYVIYQDKRLAHHISGEQFVADTTGSIGIYGTVRDAMLVLKAL
jgi:hypothetical protein